MSQFPAAVRAVDTSAAAEGDEDDEDDEDGGEGALYQFLCKNIEPCDDNNKLVLILTRHTLARAALANRPY